MKTLNVKITDECTDLIVDQLNTIILSLESGNEWGNDCDSVWSLEQAKVTRRAQKQVRHSFKIL